MEKKSETVEEVKEETPIQEPETGEKNELEQDAAADASEENTDEEVAVSGEEAQSEEPEKKDEFSKKWYVIHTLSGHEQKVKKNIEYPLEASGLKDYIGRVLIPSETVSEVRAGKKSVTERKIFPGYVLVEMMMTNDVWHYIRETNGVIGFVGARVPEPLPEKEVKEMLNQVDDKKEKVTPKVLFDKGESVKITDGPFVNFTGVVDEVYPDKGKLKVMVSIFGRATPVELEYWQVEKG